MKVSIIVPIYNVERYLESCIESILSQTYENFELILVDDGSPDQCGIICDKYATQDSRIKVIHKENQGLGVARNTGLDYATGEFVCFVDSDDWLEPYAIEYWIRAQRKYDADIVMCNYQKKNDNKEVLYRYEIRNKECCYRGKKIEQEIFWPMIGQESMVREDFTINMCVWTNLYRRELIESEQIRFLSEREYLSEDICFNLQYLLSCKIAVMIPESLYCYRYNPTSLTSRYKGDEYQKAVALYNKVQSWAKQAKTVEFREFRVERFFITKVREVMFRLCGSNMSYREKAKVCKKILRDNTLQDVIYRYPIKRYKLKYKVPVYLMKWKNVKGTVLLFENMSRLRG